MEQVRAGWDETSEPVWEGKQSPVFGSHFPTHNKGSGSGLVQLSRTCVAYQWNM